MNVVRADKAVYCLLKRPSYGKLAYYIVPFFPIFQGKQQATAHVPLHDVTSHMVGYTLMSYHVTVSVRVVSIREQNAS